MEQLVIAYDMGTIGVKACIYDLSPGIKYIVGDGEAGTGYMDQDPFHHRCGSQHLSLLCRTGNCGQVLGMGQEQYRGGNGGSASEYGCCGSSNAHVHGDRKDREA